MAEFDDLSKTNLQAFPKLSDTEPLNKPDAAPLTIGDLRQLLADFRKQLVTDLATTLAVMLDKKELFKNTATHQNDDNYDIVTEINRRFGDPPKEVILKNSLPPDPDSPYHIESLKIRS